MNNSNYKHSANQNLSGSSSSTSSSMDLKSAAIKRKDDQHNFNQNRRARNSFLHCLGKHIGKHFPQHQTNQKRTGRGRIQNMLTVYNSEDDIHSSSTDSFSLSYERYGTTQFHNCQNTGSSADLTCDERSSGTSSAASAYSRLSSAIFNAELDDVWSKRQGRRRFYVDTNRTYRRATSALSHLNADEYSDNSQGDADEIDEAENDGDADADGDGENGNDNGIESDDDNSHTNRTTKKHNHNYENNVICSAPKKKSSITINIKSKKNKNNHSTMTANTTPSHSRSCSPSTSPCSITKGLHLSRISIASSVCRMFQHFSINSSSTTTSTRSLSCSSTPMRSSFKIDNKKSLTSNSITTRNSSMHKSSVTTTATTTRVKSTGFLNTNSSSNSNSNSKKKEKKQQSILRPPVSYVYMKGMSGLYSRVPRYTVCYPYAMHQTA